MRIPASKSLNTAIALGVAVATLPLLFSSMVSAGTSDPSSWDGYLPASDALLNQTVATAAVDQSTGTELALAADMWSMKSTGNTWDYSIRVGGTATSRRSITYSFYYGSYTPSPPGNTCNPSDWYGSSLPYSRNLGDNEGASINTAPFLWYYGAWYSSIWVSENGWVSFDRRATNSDSRWGSPTPPTTFPSTDSSKPDIVLAPFWTDLHGGQIRWGNTGAGIGYFDIAWVGVQDSSNHPQYFSISIHQTYYLNDRVYSEIRFFYCQVQNTGSVVSGIENQLGTQGVYTGHPSTQTYFHFDAGTSVDPSPSLWTAIKSIKISAHKYYSDSSGTAPDDPSASVLLRPSGNSDPPVVGGVNVQPLAGSGHGSFRSGSDSGASYLASEVLVETSISALEFSGVLLVSGEYGGVGWLLIGKELWDQWTMVWPQSSYQEATPSNGVSTAYYKGGANNEPVPDDTSWNWINWADWDIGLLPTLHWILDDPTGASNINKVHHIAISMEVEIFQFGCSSNCKTSVTTNSIILTWRPYVIGSNTVHLLDWFGRTIPSAHTYTFRPLDSSELPQGANSGYHLQSEANGETGYRMLGWGPLTGTPSGDYALDGSHRLAVDGYFRKNDAGGSVEMYVIGHYMKSGTESNDNLENIVQTIPVLSASDGTGWIRKSFVVDLGISYPFTRVKLAVGRTVNQGTVVQAVDWAGMSVTIPYYLSISAGSGGSTSPPPGSYPEVPNTEASVFASPSSCYSFDHWTLDGNTVLGNPIIVQMAGNRALAAYFAITSHVLSMSPTTGGTTNPTSGSNYTYNCGTTVTVTSSPNAGNRLGYWTLDGAYYFGTPIAVSMYSDHTLKANFVSASSRVLIVSRDGLGSTSPSPGIYTYGYGSSVQVTATNSGHWVFVNWDLDGGYSNTNPITVAMDSDHNLVAYFDFVCPRCVAVGPNMPLEDRGAVDSLRISPVLSASTGEWALAKATDFGLRDPRVPDFVETARSLSQTLPPREVFLLEDLFGARLKYVKTRPYWNGP